MQLQSSHIRSQESKHLPTIAHIPPTHCPHMRPITPTCRLSSAVLSVSAGLHWSFKMSKQMAPLAEEMLGCQTYRNGEKGSRRGIGESSRHSQQPTAQAGRAPNPQRTCTLVMNRILGGTKGYWSSSSMLM